MRTICCLVVLMLAITLPAAHADQWPAPPEYKMTKNGQALYTIRVKSGHLALFFVGKSSLDIRTTPRRLRHVLGAVLDDDRYMYGTHARRENGFAIVRIIDDPAFFQEYVDELLKLAFEIDRRVSALNLCAYRRQELGADCAAYEEPQPPTKEEVERAIESLRILWE